MKEQIKVYLPITTCPQDLFCVILKLTGIVPTKDRLGKNRLSVNVEKPCTEKNQWELVFTKPAQTCRKEISKHHHHIEIHNYDMIPLPYFFNFYDAKTVDGEILNNEKLFTGDFSGITGAIGKRLVDYFGGRVVYPSNETYICNNPIFSYADEKKKNFMNFQNTLYLEPKITPQEIVSLRKDGIASPIDLAVIYRLNPAFFNSYSQLESLEKELSPLPVKESNKKMKI